MSSLSQFDRNLNSVVNSICTDDEYETYYSAHYASGLDVPASRCKDTEMVYNLAKHFAQDDDSWNKFQLLVAALKG